MPAQHQDSSRPDVGFANLRAPYARRDLRMIGRACRHRWPLTPDEKALLAEGVIETQASAGAAPSTQRTATEVLTVMRKFGWLELLQSKESANGQT